MFSAPAVAAELPSPDGIELLDERIDEGGIIGQNTVLEVALALGLRAHARTGEVRATEIRLHAIHDDALEMDARAKHPLHRRPKRRIAVEIVPPVRSWVFRMDKPNLDPALHHPIQHLKKRHHVATTRIDIHILDVCGRDPQPLPRLRHDSADDRLINVTVSEKLDHTDESTVLPIWISKFVRHHQLVLLSEVIL